MKTIKVMGKGTGSRPADFAELSVTVKQVAKSCEEATRKAETRVQALRESLLAAELDEKQLKTLSFDVAPEYESERDNGGFKQKFIGYCCRIGLKYGLSFTADSLSRAIAALTVKGAEEAVSVSFKVKEESSFQEELLAIAYRNAECKAKAIAAASGKTLGELSEIICADTEGNFHSRTRIAEAAALTLRSAPVELNPDDVSAEASLIAVWELK